VQAVPTDEEKNEWEIGYHIAKEYTEKGYATEAVKAFLPAIMKRLNIEKIEGLCVIENYASRAVMEKCGFTLEYSGAGEYQGTERDVCRYSYPPV